MAFISRWLKKLLIVIGAISLLLLLLQATILPALVRHAIVTQLEHQGITVRGVVVKNVSWNHMMLSDVALDFGETLGMESVRIEYDLTSLLARRVSAVNVTGATLELDISDGKIDLDPLLHGERREAGGLLPVDEITITSSRLRVRKDATSTDTPIEGTLRLQKNRSWGFNLVSDRFAGCLTLAGAARSDGDVDIEIEFDNFDLHSVQALLPKSARRLSSARVDGSLSLRCAGMERRIEADGRFSARWMPQDGLPSLGAEGAKVTVDCALDSRWRISAIDVDLAVEQAGLGENELRDVHVTGRKEADLLLFTVNADHATWHFESAHGTISGLFPVTNSVVESRTANEDRSPRELEATFILDGVDGTRGNTCARADSVEATCRLSREEDGLTWADISFRIPEVAIGISASAFVASGVKGSSTLRLGATPTGTGTFEMQSLIVDGNQLPGISGIVALETNELLCSTQWPVLGEDAIVAHATLDRTPRLRAETLRVHVPPFQVEENSRFNAWIEQRTGWNVSGRFAVLGSLPPHPQHTTRDLRVILEDVTLSKAAFAVEGLAGSMVLRSFNPIATDGNQRFHIRSIESAKLRLEDGLLVFRLEGPDSVFVEQTRWRWGGGILSSLAFRYHLADPILNMTLFVENLEVADILNLIFGDRATGSGRLYGRFPLRVRWRPHPGISFGAGYLYATPEGGTFNLYDREVLKDALATGISGTRADGPSGAFREGIAEALQDFEYSSLGITFSEHERGRPAGTIHIEGEGRGRNRLPLRLTINFAEEQR